MLDYSVFEVGDVGRVGRVPYPLVTPPKRIIQYST
jgi:hypothetical protein